MQWKSSYTKHLEAEVERLRNQERILLSALLERAVSREAALMLRKPEELSLSLQNMRDRAKVHYEATREAVPTCEKCGAAHRSEQCVAKNPMPADLRHWRGARGELETASQREAASQHSNDSVERIEAKVEAARKAAVS